jgi:NADPH:quinone reductase-like Zn-dependent oxidoreductase
MGADHVLDPADSAWPERVREITGGRGADVALEIVGGEQFTQTLSCLAPFGRLVVLGLAGGISPALDEATVRRTFYDPAPNQSLIAFNVGQWFALRPEPAQQAVGELIGLVASGAVEVPIAAALPLDQAARAHRMLEERRVTGKVVLKARRNGG